MGKIKTIKMGDEQAETAERAKAKAIRIEKKKVSAPVVEKVIKKPGSKKFISGPGKKYREVVMLVDKNKKYPLAEAIELVKKTSFSKFDGTVEAIFNVTEKGLRGTASLPHGTGKKIVVAVADDTLIENISKGVPIDFDVLVAHPTMMPKLAKIAKILGPKGLMPNPKTYTISDQPEKLVETLSKGQINFKTEAEFPIIHTIIGKVSFNPKNLSENFLALVKIIGREKIKTVFLKATMGPAILTTP